MLQWRMKILTWLAVVTLTVFVSGCAERNGHSPKQTSSAAMTGKPTILDVRTPEEYAGTHIPGSVNLPIDDLEQRIAAVAKDKSQPLVVHCQSGGRSARAKKKLETLGYTNVTDWGSFENARKQAVAQN